MLKLIITTAVFLMSASIAQAATRFHVLEAKEVRNTMFEPRFEVDIPKTRMVYEVLENNQGDIKVRIYMQFNVLLGRCQPPAEGSEAWTCPVTSKLFELPELELRNNLHVFFKDVYLGHLALGFGNFSVVLDKSFEVLPFPMSDSIGIKQHLED